MIIQDLTDKYIEFILRNDDLLSYKKQFPELFRYYFDFWASEKFWHKELDEKEVSRRVKVVRNRLSGIEEKLKKNKFDTSPLKVVLMVGQGTTNGHAFNCNGEFLVFLPIEGYHTDDQVDIFVTHEIFHALHYTKRPEFFFNTTEEKENFARQLITEGLASYLTKTTLNISDQETLWADYIPEKEARKWLEDCENELTVLLSEAKEMIRSGTRNSEMFFSNDSTNIRKYRAGYFVGLKIIEKVVSVRNLETHELINMPREKFERFILENL